MKTQDKYGQFGKILMLAGLAFALVIGWGWSGQLASAQGPEPSSGEVIPIVEPDSPIAEPTAPPEPTDEPHPTPPDPTPKSDDREANDGIGQEPDPSPVEVIITVEPVNTPEPTDEPGSTPSDPTAEPDTTIIVDPPSKEELGEPIKDETYVTGDDAVDNEGGVIDIFDLAFVAARYNTDDPAADINLDGTVDIFDLTILASHYGQSKPEVDVAAIVTPTPLPVVEAGREDFGAFDLPVEVESAAVETQSYTYSRPLRIGVSLNYVYIYDYMDSTSAPDPYALVAVGYVPVRTATVYNRYQAWPYWRLGWWRYAYFPWTPPYSTGAATYYKLPIDLEIRDDDGRMCYGYYGCRNRFEHADISSLLYRRTKRLDFYPARCMVIDEAGTRTYGQWFDANRCRVYLQSWGTEWPRAYVSYYVDALWE
jgi:hypothetical protein